MSAARLREAVSLLRSLAEAATPGPWAADDIYSTVTGKGYRSASEAYDRDHRDSADDDLWVIPESMDSGVSRNNLDYIATMSPPVALALAYWLDYTASIAEPEEADALADAMGCDCPYCAGIPKALAVADAILGSAS